jgi:malate dehydrogenase (oxaloacetate-decarboxylating)
MLEPTFGGVNLEDIGSPRCFEIEKRLKEELNIPVFHDDQHGTAIVVSAGVINALKLVGKTFENSKFVVNGPGAAGTAIIKMLINLGAGDIVVCDENGILFEGKEGLKDHKIDISKFTNKNNVQGNLTDAMKDADVFIGVSVANIVSEEMVSSMNDDAIIFAMANPSPEILPDVAKKGGAKVIGTGRSDFPNQINNVLAFPGIFRGAFDVNATDITEDMKVAAAYAIAGIISEDELTPDYVIPGAFNEEVAEKVATAVAESAKKTGHIRK